MLGHARTLTSILLEDCHFTSKKQKRGTGDLSNLLRLKNLERFHCIGMKAPPAVVMHTITRISTITDLIIKHDERVMHEDMEAIGKGLPRLMSLDLSALMAYRSQDVVPEGLVELQSLKQLRSLSLGGRPNERYEYLVLLIASLPLLDTLMLTECRCITDDCIEKSVKVLPKLKKLAVAGTGTSGRIFKILAEQQSRIEELHLGTPYQCTGIDYTSLPLLTCLKKMSITNVGQVWAPQIDMATVASYELLLAHLPAITSLELRSYSLGMANAIALAQANHDRKLKLLRLHSGYVGDDFLKGLAKNDFCGLARLEIRAAISSRSQSLDNGRSLRKLIETSMPTSTSVRNRNVHVSDYATQFVNCLTVSLEFSTDSK
jgi:hypothetical protein